jgi:hypothetical protein
VAPESKDEQDKRFLEELKGKNIAHYSVMLAAWMQTKMEHDKTLVTLSFGGIALLVTVISLTGLWSVWSVLLFAGAFGGFLLTIGCALVIYERNAAHIESELRGAHKDFKLKLLDKFLKFSFLFAVVCAIFASTLSIWSKQMAEPTKTTTQQLNESLRGIETLKPKDEVRSLSGIENLKPPTVIPAPEQPATSGTAQSQAPAGQAQSDKPK